MRFVWMCLAGLAGVALGWVQLKILLRALQKPNIWLFVAKLPLWALPMLTAAYLSVGALLCLTVGASCTYIGFAVFHWVRLRKGERV